MEQRRIMQQLEQRIEMLKKHAKQLEVYAGGENRHRSKQSPQMADYHLKNK